VTKGRSSGLVRRLAAGAVAGAVGTAAMDLLLYRRYRREGGKEPPGRWELAVGVTSWDEASAPGQLGQKVVRRVTRRPSPDSWARTTTNVVQWATGIGWGPPVRRTGRQDVPAPVDACRRTGPGGVAGGLRDPSAGRASTGRSGSTTRRGSPRTCPPTSCSAPRRAPCSPPSPGRDHDRCNRRL
jgi:hypothetical protein